jgi:NAD(P) transhydrogenase subunit alpha
MKIGVLKPNDSRDLRSLIHPETIGKLSDLEGLNISFEHGVGAGISISDEVLVSLRAHPQTRLEIIQQSDFIFIQDVLTSDELSSLKSGATLIGIVSPFANKEFIHDCASKKINLVSMEFVPRITRAQKNGCFKFSSKPSWLRCCVVGIKKFSFGITNDDDCSRNFKAS